MDPKTGRPAHAHIHRSTEIYRGRVFSFVTGRSPMRERAGAAAHLVLSARGQWISAVHLNTMSISRCRDSEMYFSL